MKSFDFSDRHPRDQIADICRRIYRAGLTTTSGGNLSILDGDGTLWVTPAAVDKGTLRAEDVVGLCPDGSQSGSRRPSSETPFHRAIYRARPDLRAVIHAHPPALVAFSIAHRQPQPEILPRLARCCGQAGYAAYEPPGSEELGAGIAAEFGKRRDAVIMENHGGVVGGRDLLQAFFRFEAFESAAQTELIASILGVPPTVGDDTRGEPQTETFEAAAPNGLQHERATLARLTRRAWTQKLTASLSCRMSVRCGDGLLITPRHVPAWGTETGDAVFVPLDEPIGSFGPGSMTRVHRAIYRHNPQVRAVMAAPPPHVMAFGVTDTVLDVRTIPESWILLQDIPLVDHAVPDQDPDAFGKMFGPARPSVLVSNDALYVTGETPLQAFDRLEVAELSARALLLGRQLGRVSPMSDEQVDALRRRFLAPGSPGLSVSGN